MDRSDMGKLREIFLQADTENTGTITMQELISSIRRVSPDIDEKRTKDLFSGIDRDKSGHIHYAEFLAALAESHGLVTLNRLSEAFDRIDTDGKGWIGHEDLKRILGKDYDKETVDKMIEEGDFKKNGKIDYEELLQLMFSDPAKGAEMVTSLSAPDKISAISDESR
jgi:calcium-dependent protein kinase